MESLIADHATADCCYCACAARKEEKEKKWTPVESIIGYRCFTLSLFSVASKLGEGTEEFPLVFRRVFGKEHVSTALNSVLLIGIRDLIIRLDVNKINLISS